jgi:hypothetical protein
MSGAVGDWGCWMDQEPTAPEGADKKPHDDKDEANKPSDGAIVVNIEQAVIETVTAQQQPKEKRHDWYDKTHLGILAATFASAFAAAIFTGWLAVRTQNIADDSHQGLISATSAWIAPIAVKFDGPLVLNANMRAKIFFENVGKEAAWDVVDKRQEGSLFPVTIDGKGTPYIDVQTNPWPRNTACGTNPDMIINRGTVYASYLRPTTEAEFRFLQGLIVEFAEFISNIPTHEIARLEALEAIGRISDALTEFVSDKGEERAAA